MTKKGCSSAGGRVTLRTIADRLGLTPPTISVVLNGRPAADAIPQSTKDRIRQMASELNYRPNYFARSLSLTKRTHAVAVVAAEIASQETALVLAGVQGILRERGYLMFVSLCDGYASERFLAQLAQHGMECVIALGVKTDYLGALPIVELDFAAGAPRTGVEENAAQLRAAAEVAVLSLLTHVETGQRPRKAAIKARVALADSVAPFPARSKDAEAVVS